MARLERKHEHLADGTASSIVVIRGRDRKELLSLHGAFGFPFPTPGDVDELLRAYGSIIVEYREGKRVLERVFLSVKDERVAAPRPPRPR